MTTEEGAHYLWLTVSLHDKSLSWGSGEPLDDDNVGSNSEKSDFRISGSVPDAEWGHLAKPRGFDRMRINFPQCRFDDTSARSVVCPQPPHRLDASATSMVHLTAGVRTTGSVARSSCQHRVPVGNTGRL